MAGRPATRGPGWDAALIRGLPRLELPVAPGAADALRGTAGSRAQALALHDDALRDPARQELGQPPARFIGSLACEA